MQGSNSSSDKLGSGTVGQEWKPQKPGKGRRHHRNFPKASMTSFFSSVFHEEMLEANIRTLVNYLLSLKNYELTPPPPSQHLAVGISLAWGDIL